MSRSSTTVGRGVRSKKTPPRRSQGPEVVGLLIDTMSVSFRAKTPSKVYAIQSAPLIALSSNVTLIAEESTHRQFRGTAFAGAGLRLYTRAKYQRGPGSLYASLEIYSGSHRHLESKDRLLEVLNTVAEILGLYDPVVSRADIAVDFTGRVFTWSDLPRVYSQLEPRRLYPATQDFPLESLTQGNRKRAQASLYDKRLELSRRNKSIRDLYPHLAGHESLWRLEFRAMRAWLRQRGFRTPMDVFQRKATIMRRVMTNVFYHRGRNGRASRPWIHLREQLNGGKEMPTPQHITLFDREREARAVAGYLARYSAFTNISDPQQGIKSVLMDLRRTGLTWDELLAQKIKSLNGKERK